MRQDDPSGVPLRCAMNIREETEQMEHRFLSPCASFSDETRGREKPEVPCDIRTDYQRDRDRILHSKSFRRLKQKTQVFLSPKGDHYRTRLTHSLEVAQLSRTIARALRMNEDLADAIALGHDLGHTPYGHAGERALNEVCPLGFTHYEQSIRIVELLEKNGEGLNLTWETRDGILNHQMSSMPHTLEGQIVRLCDKIAYIHHDMDDAQRAGILTEEDIPSSFREIMGGSTKERLNTLIHDVIANSLGRDQICMSPGMEDQLIRLRAFMFENVYRDPIAKGEESKAVDMIQTLYHYYIEHMEKMSPEYRSLILDRKEPVERVVCDYIAGMSDLYANTIFTSLFVPKAWSGP